MQQRAIMVTGANGLVGTRVVQLLLLQGYEVHAVVHHKPPEGHPALHPKVRLHTMDLSVVTEQSLQDWFKGIRPRALIHCAALTNVDACERRPEQAYAVNARSVSLLSRICAFYQVHCLMVSTDYVFGGVPLAAKRLYHEDDPASPVNSYGQSKWQGEQVLQKECRGKAPWTVCRTSVVYGPTPWTHTDFTYWLYTRLSRGEQVHIVDDQVSSPTSSVDLASMLVHLMSQQAEGIYHTAGSTVIDRYHLALCFAHHLELDETLIQPISSAELGQIARRPSNVALNIDKVSQQLGQRPLLLAEGLAQCWPRSSCMCQKI